MNNKGVTLLEMLIVFVLIGIAVQLLSSLTLGLNRSMLRAVKVQRELTTINPAISPGSDERTYLPIQNECQLLKGAVNTTVQWYAKRYDADTVQFYKNSNDCTIGYIGTLTAKLNPTYDDDTTNTFWNVSSSGSTLRVLVRKLNLRRE